jgi:hypothetical protein
LIDEESTLVTEADKDIQQAFHHFGNSPQLARKMIKVLNSKSKEEVSKKEIKCHTSIFMETKNIFTKRHLIQQAQNKYIMVQRNVESFSKQFKNLVEMVLPSYCDKKGNVFTFENYKQNLIKAMEDSNKFKGVTGMIRGQTIVECL